MPAWGQTQDTRCNQDKERGHGGQHPKWCLELASASVWYREPLEERPGPCHGKQLEKVLAAQRCQVMGRTGPWMPPRPSLTGPALYAPRPGQASASSHLTGLVAEPAASTCPSPNNSRAGQAALAWFWTPAPRGGGSTVLGTMVGARPRQSGHCPASVRLTWANTHTQPLPSSGSNHSSFLAPTSSSVKGGNV